MPTVPTPDRATLAEWAAKGLIPPEQAAPGQKPVGKPRRQVPLVARGVRVEAGFRAFVVPVETRPSANGREWRDRSRLAVAARLAWAETVAGHLEFIGRVVASYRSDPGYRIRVEFHRLAPGTLDPANLPNALKPVEDAVALWCGNVPDRPPRWVADYHQERNPAYGVRVEMWQEGAI